MIADKRHDAGHCTKRSQKREPKSRRRATATSSVPDSTDLYKERNVIERFFNKLRQFPRVETRYYKLPANS